MSEPPSSRLRSPDGRSIDAALDRTTAFIRSNAVVLVTAAGAMILAYGFALTSFSLSVDEEVRFLDDSPSVWVDQGRPVIALLKVVLADLLPLPFMNLGLALLALFASAVLWAALFVRAWGREGHGPGLLMFLIVFTTLPLNAYYLHFNTFNVEVSLGLVWAAGSAWLAWSWAVDGRGRAHAAASVGLALLAVGTYQNLAFAIIAGVLMAQLVRLLARKGPEGPRPTLRATERSLRLAGPAVVALVLGAAFNLIFVARGGYTESFIAWGVDDPIRIVGRLARSVLHYVAGLGFEGGWVLIPSVVAAAAVLVLVVRWCLRAGWWFPLALLIVVGYAPFALSSALGTPLPNRAMQALPLVAAGMWLLLAMLLEGRRWMMMALIVMAGLFAVWNAGITTRLFLTEKMTYETDRVIATRIAERLAQAGWDGQPLPIVAVGSRPHGALEGTAVSETFGGSFFNWDQGLRTSVFMTVLGYPLRYPGPEHVEAGLARSQSMPVWPAAGSVIIEDGLVVVKLSEP
jgi:hypothetical protein